MKLRTLLTSLSLAVMASGALANGTPMSTNVDVRDCRATTATEMPVISWGADAITLEAKNDIRAGGLDLTMAVNNDLEDQLENYLTCQSPFLRGTLGMLMSAGAVTENDPRTNQVVIYKHSWSAGDAIVGAAGIKSVKDLAGKIIAAQSNGPSTAFLARVLSDAGLSLRDVTILWVDDLTGDGDTPYAAMVDGRAQAALVITPDALTLTSGGSVGTGSEGSLQGATITVSTREAASVVGDYISVRRDFFDANREAIAKMVNALFVSEETIRTDMSKIGSAEQERISARIADELLGGLPMIEGLYLWQDAITDGWAGNAKHFADENDPRRFAALTGEVNIALKDAGLLAFPVELDTAGWNYAELTAGLNDISDRQIAAFDSAAAAKAVDTLRKTGQLDANTKIDYEIFFEPDSNNFPIALYADEFEDIVRLAATYSGAIITIEGHSDPLHYLKQEKAGANQESLRAIYTSAMNLSLDRANAVMAALSEYAETQGVTINVGQFIVDGVGITEPAFNPPTTEAEWRQNMRVKFRVLTSQAEATTFSPL
jgi:ABC-type nitrate/sulfonate/bicarbonate transport system substrate-binding protein